MLALSLWAPSRGSIEDPANDFRVRKSASDAGFTTVSCKHGMVEVGALEKMDRYGRIYWSTDSCGCDEESIASRLSGPSEGSSSGDVFEPDYI